MGKLWYRILYSIRTQVRILGDTICGIDISWYRGDVRTYDFIVSTSNDGIKFDNIFFSKSNGKTNSLERYLIPDSALQAKYVRITVNGNTENPWAGITEVQILSQSTCPCPPTTPPDIPPVMLPPPTQPTTPPDIPPVMLPPPTQPTTPPEIPPVMLPPAHAYNTAYR